MYFSCKTTIFTYFSCKIYIFTLNLKPLIYQRFFYLYLCNFFNYKTYNLKKTN